MKKLKNQKGITLVALVVTIIVLLILAGVSVSLVAGSNGMMDRATNAVSKSDVGTAKEQAELEIMTVITDYYDAKYVSTPRETKKLAEYVESKFTSEKTLTSGAKLSATGYDSSEATPKTTFTLTVGSEVYEANLTDAGNLGSWTLKTS